MHLLPEVISHLEQRCGSKGGRLTRKRKVVLSSLLLMDKAASAYELEAFCRQQGEDISVMSVYRSLEYLQAHQLVHKLNVTNKYVVCCDLAGHHHGVTQFLVCQHCLKVKEVALSQQAIQKIIGDVESEGFQLVDSQVEISCVCEGCVSCVV